MIRTRVTGRPRTLRVLLGPGRTLRMRWIYAKAHYKDSDATLDDLREAVTTLEDTERTARRVMGGAHPTTAGIEKSLRNSRKVLRAREAPPQNA